MSSARSGCSTRRSTYWREPGRADERAGFRFHHVSTDEVFGDLPFDGGVFTEETAYAPSSPYSASKAAADHLVRAWHETYGLPVVLSNCSNNYGPFHFPEKLIPLVILNALEGKPLPVYGRGENVRDWLHVEDHAARAGADHARGRVGESYNVGGRVRAHQSCRWSRRSATCSTQRRWSGEPRRDLITFVDDRPGHDRRYAIDPTKIETRARLARRRRASKAGWRRRSTGILANEWWWRPIREANMAATGSGSAG